MKRLLPLLCLLVISACGKNQVADTALPPTETPIPATATATFSPHPPANSPTSQPQTGTSPELLSDRPYRSQTYGYSLAYPDGWQAVELGDMVILLDDPSAISTQIPTRAVIVSAGPVETFMGGMLNGVSLEESDQVLQAAAPQLLGPGFDLAPFDSLTVGNLPAIGASYTGQDESGVQVQGLAVLTLSDQRAALLLASAPVDEWPSLEPMFRSMLETFTFLDS